MSEIGWPPVLRIRHQGMQVLDHGVEVEALELLGVVESLIHRIGKRRIPMQHFDVERVGPPIPVARSVTAGEWAFVFSLCVHVGLRVLSGNFCGWFGVAVIYDFWQSSPTRCGSIAAGASAPQPWFSSLAF